MSKEKQQTKKDSEPKQFHIVGIGASAGGVEALKTFLSNLPERPGMAFVIVLHQYAKAGKGLLTPVLSRNTSMEVLLAEEGVRIEPDHIYVMPPGHHGGIFNKKIQLFKEEAGGKERLPIDFFLRSLAEAEKEWAVGVMLSGADTDGTLGIKEIKSHGGLVMAQDPATAEFDTMPKSVVDTGLADFVLPVGQLPERLLDYVRHATAAQTGVKSEVGVPDIPEKALDKIYFILKSQTKHDFSQYKPNTMARRIKRRMDILQLQRSEDYSKLLSEDPKEGKKLFKDLLIGVTTFFRDPEAFEALKEFLDQEYVPKWRQKDILRVWVPGCSTGEEAYSLAILLKECAEQCGLDFKVQIYATDLDEGAIDTARQGSYPSNILADVSDTRLNAFFTKTNGTYQVKREIRESVVFATQNLISDPPFSKLDLVCCRNLLIYFDLTAQKKALSVFHYSLNENGILFLGPSEGICNMTDLFKEANRKWRIFTRKPVRRFSAYDMKSAFPRMTLTDIGEADNRHIINRPAARSTKEMAERFILSRCAPPSVLIDQQGEILFIHGKTGKYLEPQPGEPTYNILRLARDGLKLDLSAAIGAATAQKRDTVRWNVAVKTNGDVQYINLFVKYIQTAESEAMLLMVMFQDMASPLPEKPTAKGRSKVGEKDRRIQQLETEIEELRENLQASIEEFETSNEELKSTNEELQSSNEELQSTNEELETAKEELQAVNEELTTLNAELNGKIEELTLASNDMANLLSSTEIATLFLDNDLNISRFTPAIHGILSLIDSDAGRPVSHIALNLKYGNMMEDAKNVLTTLHSKEIEVQGVDGLWYQMRILPYRTRENVIDGLVLTFMDVTGLKKAEEMIQQARAYAESIVETVREPLLVLDANQRVLSANRSFYRTFKVTPEATVGRSLSHLGSGQWDIPELQRLLREILPQKTTVEAFKVEHDFAGVGRRVMLLNARRMDEGMVLLAMEDATDRARVEKAFETCKK